MKITKSRLIDLIKEEAERLATPEEKVVEEGIFDFLTGTKSGPSHGEKLNKAFGVLVAQDQRLKAMIQDSTREMKRLFTSLEAKIDKLTPPEETPPDDPKSAYLPPTVTDPRLRGDPLAESEKESE
jgi:hypothetical protein